MTKNNHDPLKVFLDTNKLINDILNKYKTGDMTSDQFRTEYADAFVNLLVGIMPLEFDNNPRVISEFGNFYSSIVDKLYGELSSQPAAQTDLFNTLQVTTSFSYIFAAYLLRADNIKAAEEILTKKSRHLLPTHYLSRAILTISSRNGQTSAMKGWFIGIGINIFRNYKDISNFFYDDQEDFTDYLCQVDFLQFLLEYLREEEITAGYPNFVLFEKKGVEPILETLRTEYGREKVEDVIKFGTELDSGNFFMSNLWN